jgi:hypothetical protein
MPMPRDNSHHVHGLQSHDMQNDLGPKCLHNKQPATGHDPESAASTSLPQQLF